MQMQIVWSEYLTPTYEGRVTVYAAKDLYTCSLFSFLSKARVYPIETSATVVIAMDVLHNGRRRVPICSGCGPVLPPSHLPVTSTVVARPSNTQLETMPATSLLSLQPTFLQGFVVGQISILLLLALILKYLFFESAPPGSPTVLAPLPAPRFQQRDVQNAALDAKQTLPPVDAPRVAGIESVEWFNLIIREVRSGGFPSDRQPLPTQPKRLTMACRAAAFADCAVIQNSAARRSRGISW